MMNKLEIKEIAKLKPNVIFKGMSKSLKDPKNYKDIEKKLTDIVKSDHLHKTVKAYATCVWCNSKREERKKLMKDLGFKSISQYLEWKKVMLLMIKKENFVI